MSEVELLSAPGRTSIDADGVVHLRIGEDELADFRAEVEVS